VTAQSHGMEPTIVIGQAEGSWARRLLAAMPFGAMAHFRSIHKSGDLTVRDVLDDVDRLREVLVEHASSCEAAGRELAQLRADVASVRRVFGVSAALHGYDADGRPITVRA
jgi:hypothetical protein